MTESPGQVLICDASFSGFLCAAAEAVNAKRNGSPFPDIRMEGQPETLFETAFRVPRDEKRAERFCARIAAKAGQEAVQQCLEAFCSDHPGILAVIAQVLYRAAAEGKSAIDDWEDPAASRFQKAVIRAKAQAHLVSGLIRFSELADGTWYSAIEPECNVLPLIGEHFTARYAGMRFVIHDRKRNTALLHQAGADTVLAEGFSLQGTAGDSLPLTRQEAFFRAAWAAYFSAVAIAERKNPRLQASRMPRKYWKLLPEMNSPGEYATLPAETRRSALPTRSNGWTSNPPPVSGETPG